MAFNTVFEYLKPDCWTFNKLDFTQYVLKNTDKNNLSDKEKNWLGVSIFVKDQNKLIIPPLNFERKRNIANIANIANIRDELVSLNQNDNLFMYQDCTLLKICKFEDKIIMTTNSSAYCNNIFVNLGPGNDRITYEQFFKDKFVDINTLFDPIITNSTIIFYFRIVCNNLNNYSHTPYPNDVIFLGVIRVDDRIDNNYFPVSPNVLEDSILDFPMEYWDDNIYCDAIWLKPTSIDLDQALAIFFGNQKTNWEGTGMLIGSHGPSGNIQYFPNSFDERVKVRCSLTTVPDFLPPIDYALKAFYNFVDFLFTRDFQFREVSHYYIDTKDVHALFNYPIEQRRKGCLNVAFTIFRSCMSNKDLNFCKMKMGAMYNTNESKLVDFVYENRSNKNLNGSTLYLIKETSSDDKYTILQNIRKLDYSKYRHYIFDVLIPSLKQS